MGGQNAQILGGNMKIHKNLYRRALVFVVIGLFIGAGVVPSVVGVDSSFGNTIYVDDDNIDGPWDGTEEHPYRHIQNAIDDATNDDTVFVYSGIYYENVHINKTINLTGEDRDTTIIDGGGVGDTVQLTANGVTISKFTIQNGGSYTQGYCNAGLEVCSNSNIIRRNNISNNNYVGIYFLFDKTTNCNIVSDNRITNNNGFGIYMLDSSDSIIRKNYVANNFNGIFVGSGTIPRIRSCHIDDSHGNSIYSNMVIKNDCFGIVILHAHNGTIFYNNISENDLGIFIEGYYWGSCNNNIYRNNIVGNSWGIYLYGILGGACNNKIHQNNFFNNNISAFFTSCINEWNNNYWDGARLFPKPIFGMMVMIGKSIPWVNFDWHPSREPYEIYSKGKVYEI